MRILVTGSAGDFGRDLCPWLGRRHEVRATDLRPVETDLEFVQADLTDARAVAGLCEGVEAVVHLAAALPTSEHSTQGYVDANTRAVALLAEEAVRAGVRRLVYISTVWATGHGPEEGTPPLDESAPSRPLCLYGLTKYLGEVVAEYYGRNQGLSVLVLRACGYVRHEGFDAEGSIDWALADLASVADRFTRPGQKLFHPGDLGPVMEAAVSIPGLTFDRCLIGLTTPFTRDDADLCRTDPVAAWDKYYPGAAECFAAIGHQPPPLTYYYDNSRSRKLLGFEMRYSLTDVISEWRRREGKA